LKGVFLTCRGTPFCQKNNIGLSMKDRISVPLDVPQDVKGTYIFNYQEITHKSGRLMLFAGDQKIEHLNDDFYGEGKPQEEASRIYKGSNYV